MCFVKTYVTIKKHVHRIESNIHKPGSLGINVAYSVKLGVKTDKLSYLLVQIQTLSLSCRSELLQRERKPGAWP